MVEQATLGRAEALRVEAVVTVAVNDMVVFSIRVELGSVEPVVRSKMAMPWAMLKG